MLRYRKVIFLLFTLPLMATTCTHLMTTWASAIDVSVSPNPIIISEHIGQFQSQVSLSPFPEFKKIDSLTLTYTIGGKEQPLGIDVFYQSELKLKQTLKYARSFEFEHELIRDSIPVFVHLTLYKKHKTRTGPKLEIARLVNSH